MEELTRIVWLNQPVLTTKQLAAVYKCPVQRIQHNFRRARAYFKAGLHYFTLRQFKVDYPLLIYKSSTHLYLW